MSGIFPDWLKRSTGSVGASSGASIDKIVVITDNVNQVGIVEMDQKDSIPTVTGIESSVTTLIPQQQMFVSVLGGETENDFLPFDSVADLSYPLIQTNSPDEDEITKTPSVMIMPLSGGGRGPVINEGETITLSLLKTLLTGAIQAGEMHPSFLADIYARDLKLRNRKDQSGYAEDGDTITLSHDWSGYPPQLSFELAHGQLVGSVVSHVGVDPDCVTYVDIPVQEVIYGHSGIINDNEFTVHAAVLEKEDPSVNAIAWDPSDVTAPPVLTVATAESGVQNTVADCMAFRIKGNVGLTNELSYAVSGTMYAQVSVDGGSWLNIAAFYWSFEDNDTGSFTHAFDEYLVFAQGAHTYKFRGQLVVDSDDEPNRRLTGSIQIDTVTESGSGTIISNDLRIKWTSKERL